jgi:hypothetical protein
MARGRADMSAVAALRVMRDRSHDRNWPLNCALGGTRTPNLLIRSKIRLVQIRSSLSIRPAGKPHGGPAVPAPSTLVQIRC